MNAITRRSINRQSTLLIEGRGQFNPSPYPTHLFDALGECVYAMMTPGDLVKIGFASHPKIRLAQLGGYRNLLALWVGGTYDDEQAIHASLRGHAVKGREWYDPNDPDVVQVVNGWRTSVGLTPLECLPLWH